MHVYQWVWLRYIVDSADNRYLYRSGCGLCIIIGASEEPLSQQCHRFLQLHTCMSDVSKGVLSANLFQHSIVVLLRSGIKNLMAGQS